MLLTDLAFPVLHAMLRMRKETDLLPVLEEGYSELPGNPDNRILKRMRTQCFPGRSRIFRSAVCQQGLIGLYRDFCQPASFLCSRCPLFASLHGEK